MSISFVSTQTVKAFEISHSLMNHMTYLVHDELLFGDFFANHSRKISKTVEGIASQNTELSKTAFISQLADRISDIPVKEEYTEYDIELVHLARASLIISILIDNKTYKLREEGKSVMVKGKRVVIPVKYVVLGGSPSIKDLQYGYSATPGHLYAKKAGKLKLNSEIKALYKRMASIPFVVSDVMTPELLSKGYSLMDDYRSVSQNEAGVSKRLRYSSYKDAIVDLGKQDMFFLPVKPDSRYRTYYEAQLPGLRPQGKLWETLLIDSYIPSMITSKGADHIRHIIYVLRHGRTPILEALSKFSQEDLDWAGSQDPMDIEYVGGRKEIDRFGIRILANKCYTALELHGAGYPCHYLFGKDLTNSGLLMAGSSFRSEKMMLSANLIDHESSHNSHTDFGNVYNLPLEDSKPIHMQLLHGSTPKTTSSLISKSLGIDVDEETIRTRNREVYGDCVDNIDAIATWGSQIVANNQTTLRWKTPDHLIAEHSSVMTHVPIEVYSASYADKKSYVKDTVIRTMPLALDINQYPIYSSGQGAGIHSKDGIQLKVRGLYANITHSLDGYLLRRVVRRLLSSGQPFLLKHDDYMVMPDAFDQVIDEAKVFFRGAAKMNYYQRALDEIAASSGGRAQYVPKVILGDCQEIDIASNFLMP